MQERFRDDIAARFLREARTFINELIEGTNNYRQLYSLSEQFPHDYYDRFLVELIQNANDASTGGEVRIVLDEIGNDTPILYVANQGKPFIFDNFEALCSLGLSDKDPNEAIGNKGLGFRSVLQVCRNPHIYSAADDSSQGNSEGFNGYCFRLSSSSRNVVTELIDEIQHKDSRAGYISAVVKKYFGVEKSLISEPSRIEKLHSRIEKGGCIVKDEVQYLSPYSFPLPLTGHHSNLEILYRAGFVTVIELVLNKPEDLIATRRAINNIVPEYLLFTPRLTKLSVEHRNPSDEENLSLVLEKKPVSRDHKFFPPSPLTGLEIVRTENRLLFDNTRSLESNGTLTEPMSRVWWMHTGDVTGDKLKEPLQELPKKWQKITKATVNIALERTMEEPPTGFFSIYLPTEQDTGSPVSVNGPFYGNLARTEIKFSKTYNNLLLTRAVELLIDMLNVIAKTGSIENGTAMLDLLDSRDSSSALIQLLDKTLEDSGTPLKSLDAVYVEPPDDDTALERVLAPISDVRMLPKSKQPRQLLIPSRLTKFGPCFPANIITENRGMVLNRLAGRACSSLTPEDAEIASWLEKMAFSLLESGTALNDWNIFYREISDLNETLYFQDALRTCRFLLTEDQRIVASEGDGPRIFAFPQRTILPTENEEQQEDETRPRIQIPSRINPSVAFFNSGILLFQEGPARLFNLVGRFLRLGTPPMIRDFDTRTIVNEVIIPLVSQAAQAKQELSSEIYAQALHWAHQLYSNVRMEATFTGVQWSRLYVPTVSDWKPASQAYFSAGWKGTSGNLLEKAFPPNHPVLDNLLVSPEEFAVTVVPGTTHLSESEIHDWVFFLRDQANVAPTPRGVATVFQRNRPSQEQVHLRMSGYNTTYETSELTNYFSFPDSFWDEYTAYLRHSLQPPIQSYDYYYIDRQAVLEGLLEINNDTAIAYAQLVALGFSGIRGSLSTGVKRYNVNAVPSYQTAESSLSYALKHLPWIPYVGENESSIKGLIEANKVWFVPPDILESPPSRIRYSFVNHLPKEVAQVFDDEFCQFLGLRSIKITSAEEGLILLADLASSWKGGLSPERHLTFVEFWREVLVETARLWRDVAPAEREQISHLGRERGLDGLMVTLAGQRFPKWRDLGAEEDSRSLVYLPDEPDLKSAVSEWVDLVEMRGELIDSQVSLLKYIFGSKVACISELEFLPQSSQMQDIESRVESAPLLSSRFPWLEAFALAIFGLGRIQEMNLLGNEFRQVARNFRQLKYLEVPDLQLRITGLDTDKPLLSPACYFWDKHNIILLCPDSAETCEDLVSGLRGFFGVQDIESHLILALSKLDNRLDDDEQPEYEDQLRALQVLHINADQFTRVRQLITSGDDEWILVRMIPTILALNEIAGTDEARKITDDIQGLVAEYGVKKTLQETKRIGLYLDKPNDLYQLMLSATGDDDMAFKLWSHRKVPLATWNDAINALGYPYRTCVNNEVDDEFYIVLQELKPVINAILREAVIREKSIERYVALKDGYNKLLPHPEWKERYWQLPFGDTIALIRSWLVSQIPSLGKDLLEILSISANSNEQIKTTAIKLVLDLNHDDDLIERQNRLKIEELLNSCLIHLIAVWIASGHEKSAVPSIIANAQESERLFSRENIKSNCQVYLLTESNYMEIIITHFSDHGVFNQLGIEPKSWCSLADMVKDLPVTTEQLELAAERLTKMREHNERKARTRTILGADYEIPRGDVFEGLGDVINAQLSGDLLEGINLFRAPVLDAAPKRTTPSSRGKPGGGRGGISNKDRELIGATGEYILYKALCHQIGVYAAGQAWKSRNRRHFLADDTGDDSLGYDFEFPREGIFWQIEVKSSQSEPQFVDLTDTEVDVARSAAKRRSHKNYTIYLVTNTLSQPEVHPLGNPFVHTDKTRFRVEEGGARVYFKLLKSD